MNESIVEKINGDWKDKEFNYNPVYLDKNECVNTINHYSINAVPYIILYKDQKEVERIKPNEYEDTGSRMKKIEEFING